MNHYLNCGFLLLFLSGLLPAGTEPFTIKVEEGRVWVRNSEALEWENCSEVCGLTPDTLAYLFPGGRMTVTKGGASSGNQNERKTFTVPLSDAPLILRLDSSLFRETRSVSSLFPRSKATETQPTAVSSFHWRDAWRRLVFPLQTASEEEETPPLKPNIKILIPQNGMVLLTRKLPAQLSLMWSAPVSKSVKKYIVNLWEKGKPKGPPVAFTGSDLVVLELLAEGLYQVQVRSEDGSEISEPHEVTVQTMLTPLAKNNSESTAPSGFIHLLFPKPNSTYLATDFPTQVNFRWDDEDFGKDRSRSYQLTLSSKAHGSTTRQTRMLSEALKIDGAGEYEWTLAVTRGQGQAPAVIARRSFTAQKLVLDKSLGALKDVFNKRGNVFVEWPSFGLGQPVSELRPTSSKIRW